MAPAAPEAVTTVSREDFGVSSKSSFGKGAGVYLYWLRSPGGLEVAVSTWGASTVAVRAPDRDGRVQDVTLNHADLGAIMQDVQYYGATVGRVASTIAGARYKLSGKEFKLSANINGQHHAHGGFRGFDKQVWHAEVLPPATPGAASVRFSYTSIDGEEGYAGTLHASVVYTVTAANDFVLEYSATTDKPTPINLTNHTYWNLSGDCARDILGHRMQICSSKIQKNPIDSAQLAPTGGTPYDFRAGGGDEQEDQEAGELIGARIAQTPDGVGYDTVYVLDDPPAGDGATAGEGGRERTAGSDGGTAVTSVPAAAAADIDGLEPELEPEQEQEPTPGSKRLGSLKMRPAARLVDEASGRVMKVVTNQPCLICYSANYLPRVRRGNDPSNADNAKKKNKKKDQKKKKRKNRKKDGGPEDGGVDTLGRKNQFSMQLLAAAVSSSEQQPEGEGVEQDDDDDDDQEEGEQEEGRAGRNEGGSAQAAGGTDPASRHRQWGAVCLETVNFIGSLRFKQLPSMVLHPGQEYYHKTVHTFSTIGPQNPDGSGGGGTEQANRVWPAQLPNSADGPEDGGDKGDGVGEGEKGAESSKYGVRAKL